MAVTVADLNVRFSANTTAAERGIDNVERKLDGARGGAGRFSAALSGIGTAAVAGLALAGTAVVGFLGASVGVAADFESQMNILTVAARSSGTAMEDLSAAALKVGSDSELVGISASEAADAMTNFYKAGLTTGEIFSDLGGYLDGTTGLTGALRAAVDLAAASELDLATASDVVAVAMATFGLGAEDAASIANTLVGAADASLASVSGLAEGLKNVGPAAAAMGISLEDTTTALALLSTRGIQGAEAGTALKSMLLNLQRPTADVTDTLAALGVSLYDSSGTMRALPDVIAALESAMSGMTDEQRQATAVTLAGSYGLNAFNVLLGEGAAGWDAMTTSIGAAATAQEVAAARTQGFQAAVEQVKGALETFMITVGTPLIQNVLTPMAQKFGEIISKATELGQTVSGELQRGFAATGSYLDAFMEALDNFLPDEQIERVWEFTDAVTSTGKQIMAIVGPIAEAVAGFVSWQDVLIALGLVVAGSFVVAWAPVFAVAAGLVGAVALLRTAWEKDWGGIQGETAGVVEFLRGAFVALQTGMAALAEFFAPAIERIKTAMGEMGESFAPVGAQFAALWVVVEPLITALAQAIGTLLVVQLDVLLNAFAAIMPQIGVIVGAMVKQVTEFFRTLTRLWESTVALVQAVVDGDWTAAWAAVQAIVQTFADYWAVTLDTILTVGTAIFTAIKETVVNTLTDMGVDVAGVMTTLKTAWSAAWIVIQSAAVAAVGVITGVLNQIVTFVSVTVPDAIQNFANWLGGLSLPNPFGGLHSALGAIQSAIDGAKTAIESFKNWLATLRIPNPFAGLTFPSLPAWMTGGSRSGGREDDATGRSGSFGTSSGGRLALALPAVGGMAAGSAGAGGVTVNLYATVANGLDVEEMAWRVAQTIQKRQR